MDSTVPITNSPTALPASTKPISILLWNVWCLPGFITDGHSHTRAALIAPLLPQFDIVVLNEAFMYKHLLLDSLKGFHVHTLARKWLSFMDSGLVIASRFPIVKSDGEHYYQNATWDALAAKGIIWAQLDVSSLFINDSSPPSSSASTPSTPKPILLDLFATHMQAGDTNQVHSTRVSQAEQAVKFINAHTAPDRLALFCGDLNMGPSNDMVNYIDHSGHYRDPNDAKHRTSAYTLLRTGIQFEDIVAIGKEQDINRFLIQRAPPLKNVDLKYVVFDKPGNRLSDSDSLVCTLHLNSTSDK